MSYSENKRSCYTEMGIRKVVYYLNYYIITCEGNVQGEGGIR